MKTIYIDSEFKCHVTNDGTMTEIQTDFFDGKCNAYIEGYCYEDTGNGIAIYPWKDYAELDNAQREHERELLAELQENSILMSDLENAYQEGVNSAYD